MHGQFEFQLPDFVRAQKHSSKEYLDLVTGLIFIGHVHRSTQYKRIIAQGSFDRLAQGEEEAKGHIRATRKADGTHEIVFIENKEAKRYVTVPCHYLTVEDAINKIENVALKLPPDSYVRVALNRDHPISSNMDVLIKMFPLLNWTKIIHEEEGEALSNELEVDETFTAITLTADNLPNMLMSRLATRVSGEMFALGESILKECL